MSLKPKFFPVDVHINETQLDKLMKGLKIQLHRDQLSLPPSKTLYFTKKQHTHLEKSKRNSKGMRILFSNEQINQHKANFPNPEEVLFEPRPPKKKLIKKGGMIGLKTIHSLAKPLIRKGLHYGADKLISKYKLPSNLIHKSVDFIGDVTGGYGFKPVKGGSFRVAGN